MQAEIIYILKNLRDNTIIQNEVQQFAYWLTDLGLYPIIRTQAIENDASLVNIINCAFKRSSLTIIINDFEAPLYNNIKRIIAKMFNRKLVLYDNILLAIKKKYEESGFKMPVSIQSKALLPYKSIALENQTGISAGFFIQEDDKYAICLPYSFKEIHYIWRKSLFPLLTKKLDTSTNQKIVYCRTCGLREEQIHHIINSLFKSEQLPYCSMSHEEGVDFRLTLCKDEQESTIKEALHKRLGDNIYSWDITKGIEEVIGELLRNQEIDLAVAESCTGGLIGHRITQVPQSSKYFKYGVVAYSNEAKETILHVKCDTLEKYGAVSAEVAEEMAKNVRKIANVHIGLSTTGIAGPDGGSLQKPVGLVYCCLSTKMKSICQSFHLSGERKSIKAKASLMALNMLRNYLITRLS
ncbi:MAG: nicotinamide-nucleotide amidohydrolase family protein [bacterium]